MTRSHKEHGWSWELDRAAICNEGRKRYGLEYPLASECEIPRNKHKIGGQRTIFPKPWR